MNLTEDTEEHAKEAISDYLLDSKGMLLCLGLKSNLYLANVSIASQFSLSFLCQFREHQMFCALLGISQLCYLD